MTFRRESISIKKTWSGDLIVDLVHRLDQLRKADQIPIRGTAYLIDGPDKISDLLHLYASRLLSKVVIHVCP